MTMLHRTKANQDGILSAGAFDSPKLLLLFGVGSAEYLQILDIPAIAELPGDEMDVQRLVEGIKYLRHIFLSGVFDESQLEELAPGPEIQRDEAPAAYVRDACNTMLHPVDTCKMSTDLMAVVDSELRVHGIEGLRIVDASIMPMLTPGDIDAPTLMVAEKVADLIKASWTRRTLMTKYSVKNPGHLMYLGVGDDL